MAKENASQVQHEQVERYGAMLDEAAKMQAKFVEQSTAAIEQMTDLMKGSLTYTSQLAADYRKLSLDTARRTAELFNRS